MSGALGLTGGAEALGLLSTFSQPQHFSRAEQESHWLHTLILLLGRLLEACVSFVVEAATTRGGIPNFLQSLRGCN